MLANEKKSELPEARNRVPPGLRWDDLRDAPFFDPESWAVRPTGLDALDELWEESRRIADNAEVDDPEDGGVDAPSTRG